MPYGSKIDDDGAEISLSYHFSAGGRGRTAPVRSVEILVPFDEITANPSNLKHVVKLMGRSDGLGVAIPVALRHLRVFKGV